MARALFSPSRITSDPAFLPPVLSNLPDLTPRPPRPQLSSHPAGRASSPSEIRQSGDGSRQEGRVQSDSELQAREQSSRSIFILITETQFIL